MSEDKDNLNIRRAPDGKLLPGSKLGKLGAGIPKGQALAEKTIARERRKMEKELKQAAKSKAESILTDALDDVLGEVYKSAMSGNVAAMNTWLKHSIPVARVNNRVDGDILEGVAELAPEDRARYINKAILEVHLDVTLGKEILACQRLETEQTTMAKVQRLARKAARAELTADDLMEELAAICYELEPLEGETEDE